MYTKDSQGEKLLNPKRVSGIIETKLLNVEEKRSRNMMTSVGCEVVSWMTTLYFGAFAFKQNHKPAKAENGGRQLKLALIAQQLNSFSNLNNAGYTKCM